MCSSRSKLVFLFLFFVCVTSSASDPSSEESNCRKYISSGFNYGHFFGVYDEDDLIDEDYGEELLLKFRVKTPSDAHIKFSEKPFPKKDEPAYEVVIGAGGNTFSFIRRGETDSSKIRLETEGFLSANETRGFWIRISEDGSINVGKEDDENPFMSWEDEDPLHINYFSFSSWKNVTAEWFYHCDELKDINGDDAEDPYLNLRDFLHTQIARSFVKFRVQPPTADTSNFTSISTHLSCSHIHLDDRGSTLNVNGILSLIWEDKRITWSPKEFQNIKYLDLYPFVMWTPHVMLQNLADSGPKRHFKSPKALKLRFYFNGTKHWRYPVQFRAFCEGIDHQHWPKDSHVCELQLGLQLPHKSIRMVPCESGIQFQESTTSSGWSVTKMNATEKWVSSPTNVGEKLDGLKLPKYSHIVIQLTLTHSYNTYSLVLTTSLAAISVLLLSSFWASPLGSVKISLQCISIVMTTLCLLFCWKVIPVSAFITTMHMEWVAILSTVITTSSVFSAPVRVHPSVTNFLKHKVLALFFCLPKESSKVSASCKQLAGQSAISKEDIQGHLFTSTESDDEWHWTLSSAFIDRIFFWVYTGLFSYLIPKCINSC
ncbi:neuronal acetylcholine receptor subunit alpha-4-like isoform X2 [Ischnura elegans]|uniref:neuronal acetylcholine receptor subunit alpha-4-like isoform X2 n=1 Tax=Ischnura elegans TaxID=197161 RepID=UPI001ED8812B|nr:neuronal acetylcholine receptor subunit alpha-4-like isoform X2 [Ischnura elegans]